MAPWSRLSDRFRTASRDKVVRVVDDVVSEHNRVLLAQIEHQHELITTLARSLEGLEYRMRRDIPFAAESTAAREAAEFAQDQMPMAPNHQHPHDTLRHALGHVEIGGLALEFGVATGTTLDIIATAAASLPQIQSVTGFDSFGGLPEAWRTGFEAGAFARSDIPEVDGADIVVGLFDETLSSFLDNHPGPVSFLHLDADLYSSTEVVLRALTTRIVPGTVIVFDEFFNYPGWRDHEKRAWDEFVARNGVTFDYLTYTANNEQVALKIT
jgi:hypothetical protein